MPFLGQTADSLLQKPAIQRMPETQREWMDFVKNLDVHLSGKLGAFTPTFGTGFSADPSDPIVYWKKVGSLVIMGFNNSSDGTSNGTAFTILAIPEKLRPVSGASGNAVQFSVPMSGLVDNGTESWGSATISSTGNIVFSYQGTVANSWTGTGDKGWVTNVDPTIVYDTKFTKVSVQTTLTNQG